MKKLIFCTALMIAPTLATAGFQEDRSNMLKMPSQLTQEVRVDDRKAVDSEPQTRSVIDDWGRENNLFSLIDSFDMPEIHRFHFEFEVGKSELSSDDETRLLSLLLNTEPSTVSIAGFTDNTGSPNLNSALARKRAEGVSRFIKAFDPEIDIVTTSSNSYPGDPENGRRVEIFAI